MADVRGQWLATIDHLVTKTEPAARLLALGDNGAALAMADGSLATVVVVQGSLGPTLAENLERTATDNPTAHLKHVIIGGDPDQVRPVLQSCQPRWSYRRAIQVYHLAADGTLWTGSGTRPDSPTGLALRAAADTTEPIARAAVEALVRSPEPPSPEERVELERGQAFLDRVRTSKPRATWGAVLVIGIVFALEMLWGGSEFAPTLIRMGANTEASLHGEPWRLAASVLLHAGIAHAAINAVVLVALGGFLERLIGPSRLLLLLVASGIGGSLASSVAGVAALSVGASGAIWGALGASAVFALRPTGVIPDAVVPSIRRAAIINLVINLSVSFLPQVDLWAHLGGGVTGAALVATGLLTRGLPGVSEADDVAREPTASWGWRIAASAASVGLVGGLIMAIATGRPWVLSDPPALEERPLGDSLVTIEVPIDFPAAETFDHEGLPGFAIGDILRDPFTLIIIVEPHTMNTAERQDANQEVRDAQPPVPDGAQQVRPWGPADVGTGAYSTTIKYDNGLMSQTWYQVQDRVRIRVDTTWWADAPQSQKLAARHAVQSIAQ